MSKNLKQFLKYVFLLFVGGCIYYGVEIMWREYSHWSMFILGGICFIYSGSQNERLDWDYPLWKQILRVDAFVLVAEFFTGCIVNLILQWHVWDYSNLPFNILGQVCPQFAFLFLPLCLVGITLDDYIRYWLFNEEKPRYRF